MIALSANGVTIHMQERPAPQMWLAGLSFGKIVKTHCYFKVSPALSKYAA